MVNFFGLFDIPRLFKNTQAPPVGGADTTRDIIPNNQEMIAVDHLIRDGVVDADGEQYLKTLRDSTVYAAFQQLQDLIGATETQVIPASDEDADKKCADWIQSQIEGINFEQAIQLMLFAVFFGKSYAEILIKNDGKMFSLESLAVRDFRRFFFDGAWRLRLRTDYNSEGILLNEKLIWQWYAHEYHGDDGGVGLASQTYYLAKIRANLMKWQANYLEKYANPPMMMYYPSTWDNMSDGGVSLKERLIKIGKNARNGGVFIVPADFAMTSADGGNISSKDLVQFIHPQGDRNQVFQSAIEYIDKQMMRLIIGQTASMEQAAGKLGNDTEQVSILKARVKNICDNMMECFNNQVVQLLVDLNAPAFTGITGYPKVWRAFPETEDLAARAARDAQLSVATGLPLEREYTETTYNVKFSEPPEQPEPEPATEQFAKNDAEDTENLAAAMSRDVAPLIRDDMIMVFSKAMEKAKTIEELQEQLPDLFDKMPKERIAATMGDWSAVANLAGRGADE